MCIYLTTPCRLLTVYLPSTKEVLEDRLGTHTFQALKAQTLVSCLFINHHIELTDATHCADHLTNTNLFNPVTTLRGRYYY